MADLGDRGWSLPPPPPRFEGNEAGGGSCASSTRFPSDEGEAGDARNAGGSCPQIGSGEGCRRRWRKTVSFLLGACVIGALQRRARVKEKSEG